MNLEFARSTAFSTRSLDSRTRSDVYRRRPLGHHFAFVDLLGNDLLIAKPVTLVAAGGSARHALVTDDHMRPLFAFLLAMVVLTALYAAPEDWGDRALGRRIGRAAAELSALVGSSVIDAVVNGAWDGYQHQFAGRTSPAGTVAIDADLMRLVAGGGARSRGADRIHTGQV
ncbi:NAD(P)H-dependent oxidoreductase [Streptomyces sp. AcE210]|uniref:NAD(P)H-dependent oxidoreductase n=1 Tax=Streptomyces sp. AcE210 TaxID=2292703 RepID=UPI000E309E8D|nr:NAD(P)H-dependent oxidoreductase [Streptomyces sp. AcE210]RFC77390.1 hypothetical protein DXZ75_05425 [Streptomyces sp. AcE210]